MIKISLSLSLSVVPLIWFVSLFASLFFCLPDLYNDDKIVCVNVYLQEILQQVHNSNINLYICMYIHHKLTD